MINYYKQKIAERQKQLAKANDNQVKQLNDDIKAYSDLLKQVQAAE